MQLVSESWSKCEGAREIASDPYECVDRKMLIFWSPNVHNFDTWFIGKGYVSWNLRRMRCREIYNVNGQAVLLGAAEAWISMRLIMRRAASASASPLPCPSQMKKRVWIPHLSVGLIIKLKHFINNQSFRHESMKEQRARRKRTRVQSWTMMSDLN